METQIKHSLLDLVSNTTGSSISASGLAGIAMIGVGLICFVALMIFYFINISEANNIFTLINSVITLIGIGSGLLGIRRFSSDFGPNNKITITEGNTNTKE